MFSEEGLVAFAAALGFQANVSVKLIPFPGVLRIASFVFRVFQKNVKLWRFFDCILRSHNRSILIDLECQGRESFGFEWCKWLRSLPDTACPTNRLRQSFEQTTCACDCKPRPGKILYVHTSAGALHCECRNVCCCCIWNQGLALCNSKAPNNEEYCQKAIAWKVWMCGLIKTG